MKKQPVSRRVFMKTVGAAGIGSVVGTVPVAAQENARPKVAEGKVPTRAYGKTGVKVSMLALGGIFDITTNQLVLQRALDFGVTYWDTANGYTNGNSEIGIGMYFEKHPEIRKEIFLVTKAGGWPSARNLNSKLEESLRRMKTDYIDMFFLHGIRNGDVLTDSVKTWVEKAKAANKIKFFGFSAHGNMARSLQAAGKLGWIDGIMLKYDFRLMHHDSMRAATEACTKAGIGLTAMKTQGGGPIHTETEADLKLGGHFVKRGFTPHQAKLKAVWENPQIGAICSQMANITVLSANTAAALDKTKLSAADHGALRQYAAETCSRYCDGCTQFCEEALANRAPIGDVMRALMYHHTYGDSQLAKEVFAGVPAPVRHRLASLDYTPAERACPRGLPIAKLMREANELLA